MYGHTWFIYGARWRVASVEGQFFEPCFMVTNGQRWACSWSDMEETR